VVGGALSIALAILCDVGLAFLQRAITPWSHA
jgi:ABC-type proline/glycine betaine transport system permease subunit